MCTGPCGRHTTGAHAPCSAGRSDPGGGPVTAERAGAGGGGGAGAGGGGGGGAEGGGRRGVVQEGGTRALLWLIHVGVGQKPTQGCKTVILQLKQNAQTTAQLRSSHTLVK